MNKMNSNPVSNLKISLIDKKNVNKTVIEELYMVTDAGFKGQSPWSVDHITHSIEANNSIIVVAAIAEKIIGFIVASETAFEIDIYMVVVAEKYKQKNIGTQLFDYLIDYTQNKNIETIVLETRASNVPALALYERVGFEKVGERKAYYNSPIEDAIVMKRTFKKER